MLANVWRDQILLLDVSHWSLGMRQGNAVFLYILRVCTVNTGGVECAWYRTCNTIATCARQVLHVILSSCYATVCENYICPFCNIRPDLLPR